MTARLSCVAALVVSLIVLNRPSSSAQSGGLPSGWQAQDIGVVGQTGSTNASSGTFTVSGAGADIWGTTDAFQFAHRTASGDVEIVARAATLQGSQPWTKVAVMIRAGTQPNAAHAMMLVSASKGLAFQRRTTTGGLSTHTSGGTGTAPRWLKLARAGQVITASISADGQAWTVVGRDTFSMPSTVNVGLAVTSHDATRLATGTFDNVAVSVPASGDRLRVSSNNHYLQTATGRHVFYFADTAWSLFKKLNRADAEAYLQDVAAKGFNAVQAVALWTLTRKSAYGDDAIGMTNGRFDPSKILTTPGNDPLDPVAYDYWDHIDYVLDKAAENGLYVALQPTWGNYVSGTTSYAVDMSSNIFTVDNARTYGEFIGRRYGQRRNVIWMLGGDRAPVYSNGDFRPVWRAMAEGIARGVSGLELHWDQSHEGWNQVLMTYQATRRHDPGSSLWFHTDPWLDLNGIQADYHNLAYRARTDWNKTPPKPTLVLEARYEDEVATDGVLFVGAFKSRYEAFHAFFAGSLGYSYGHKSIWQMLTTDKTWRMALNDPGRLSMRYFRQFVDGLSDTTLFNRVPDQTLLDGALGSATAEDLLLALRGSDRRYAMVYSTNGRDIRLKLAMIATGTADASWFNPRTGASSSVGAFTTGTGAPIQTFNPPGDPGPDNDWVLKLTVR